MSKPNQYIINKTFDALKLFCDIYDYSQDWQIADYEADINEVLIYCSQSPLIQPFLNKGLDTHDFFLWLYLVGTNLYEENFVSVHAFAEKYYNEEKQIKQFKKYLKSNHNKLFTLGLITIEDKKIGLSEQAKQLLNNWNIKVNNEANIILPKIEIHNKPAASSYAAMEEIWEMFFSHSRREQILKPRLFRYCSPVHLQKFKTNWRAYIQNNAEVSIEKMIELSQSKELFFGNDTEEIFYTKPYYICPIQKQICDKLLSYKN